MSTTSVETDMSPDLEKQHETTDTVEVTEVDFAKAAIPAVTADVVPTVTKAELQGGEGKPAFNGGGPPGGPPGGKSGFGGKGPGGLPPSHPMHPSQFVGDKWDGKALRCLFGSFCVMFCSFGWINCIGVFQAYYETHQLAGYSDSTVSWIISMELFFMFVAGPFVGKFFDNFGPRYLLAVGTFLHVLGLMMASLSTEYYQFMLSQGVCSPLGAGMLFFPAMNSTISWFLKRRALAFGSIAGGASIGGVIFPIMVAKLVPMVGFGWTMRICAFLILGLLIVGNLTITCRLKPSNKPFSIKEFTDPFKERSFCLLNAATFLGFVGLFIPISYIVVQAETVGMSTSLQNYLVPILNAASLFGRTIPGHFADRVGRFNVMIIMTLLSVLFIFAVWVPAHDNTTVILFSAFYGFSSGAYISITPTLVAEITKDMSKLGVRNGASFFVISLATLIGSPVGGQLLTVTRGKFYGLQIFSGAMLAAAAVMFVVTRINLKGRKVFVKV